ncbi:MAG TPA: WecB/TagA/CpsF family glycosyltransferase [Telluria sp.]|nr:WecB/TagA/CpsF family glycosyltransferase [Telluria sp.]
MPRETVPVLGTRIDALAWNEAVERIAGWASRRESRYVALCNVHSVVTARRERAFHAVLQLADMCAPDGAPVAWTVGRLRRRPQERINGPDLTLCLMARAARDGLRVYLYGATPDTLAAFARTLRARWPDLQLAGMYAPPFRALSAQEDADITNRIVQSGAQLVLVGLGCPKQERWMAAHCGRIPAVMLGVGAAFDYHAGTLKRAPLWWQQHGLEWFYRLLMEPRRLARRYLVTNTLFLAGVARQLAGQLRRSD